MCCGTIVHEINNLFSKLLLLLLLQINNKEFHEGLMLEISSAF